MWQGLEDADFWVRDRSIEILGKHVQDLVADDQLAAQVGPKLGRYPAMVIRRVLILTRHHHEASAKELVELLLRSRRAIDRIEALRAVRSGDGRKIARFVLDALDESDSRIRMQAVGATVRLGKLPAVGPLIERLEDESDSVREAAAVALRQLTGQLFGYDTRAWRTWWSKHPSNG